MSTARGCCSALPPAPSPSPSPSSPARLLSGSGLSYAFNGNGAVTISDRLTGSQTFVADDGSLMLDTIDISAGGISSVYSPYETAAATAHISGETIERFRGSSPADMFRGTPGVMSGEARNGADPSGGHLVRRQRVQVPSVW